MAPEAEDELTLVDRWEQIGTEHVLKVETEHDAWPKTACWVYYRPRCSCGHIHPRHSRTAGEHRPDIYVRIKKDHLKHLIQILLDEDWVPADTFDGWIPQEQA